MTHTLCTALLLVGVLAAPATSQGAEAATEEGEIAVLLQVTGDALWQRGVMDALASSFPRARFTFMDASQRAEWEARPRRWELHVTPATTTELRGDVSYVLVRDGERTAASMRALQDGFGRWTAAAMVLGCASWPCPLCGLPPLIGLVLGGEVALTGRLLPRAEGVAAGSLLVLGMVIGTCVLMLGGLGWLSWPLEAARFVAPLAGYYRGRATTLAVLPGLVGGKPGLPQVPLEP